MNEKTNDRNWKRTMEDDVTLVVPTINRHNHLTRLLTYYKNQAAMPRILVLDSSRPEIQSANAATCSGSGSSVRHVTYDSATAFALKLMQGMRLVNTPFCAICADDDVILLNGLEQAVEYLKAHSDYSCADGIYMVFYTTGSELRLSVEYSGHGITLEHPGARIFRLFQRYESMFYAAFRTRDLQDITATMQGIPSSAFRELFQSAASLIKGKSSRLPVFYSGRQFCEPAEPLREKWQTYYWFAENPAEFMQDYVAYRAQLWGFYENYGSPKMARVAFERACDLAHATYFSLGTPPEYFHSALQSMWPHDQYEARDSLGTVLQQFSPKANRELLASLCEGVLRVLNRLTGRVVSLYSQESLSRTSAIHLGVAGWKCVLPADMQWLMKVPAFGEAFQEFCRYIGPCTSQS